MVHSLTDMVSAWLAATSDEVSCRLETIPFADSAEWFVENGAIVHRSRGFFTVVGIQWTSPDGTTERAPFFEQRDVGTLGFLIRGNGAGRELLVQAKFEPGNVGFVQLAPTCQATDSNARRMHGGEAPPFIDAFPRPAPNALYDVEQSEQGTRFLGKRNRNVLVAASGPLRHPDTHRWMDVEGMLELMHCDSLVNTDARSVLVCAPWRQLVPRRPFSRFCSGFGAELMLSASSCSGALALDRVKADIVEARAKMTDPTIIRLFDVLLEDGPVRVRQIRVTARGREVPSWDQPMIDSRGEGKVLLACARIDGILHFLFRAQAEPGLHNKVELTPTVVVEPGKCADEIRAHGEIVAECRQSEEGGRFYRDTNLYQIVDMGERREAGAAEYWLTLGDLRQLLDEPGWLTNEARSALSLLLPWL